MSAPPERIHNVIAVLEQFTDQGTKTVPMVAEETGLPEPVVRDCLGRLEDADLLIRDGTIVEVGTDLRAPRGAVEHIHSGVTSVNETGATMVPEVRMGDVLTHNNIWVYRQLAGGLTTAMIKHGSANPIGGENVIVKMRWGALPDDMVLEDIEDERVVTVAVCARCPGVVLRCRSHRVAVRRPVRGRPSAVRPRRAAPSRPCVRTPVRRTVRVPRASRRRAPRRARGTPA